MEKSKFTLRLDESLLKDIKKLAIDKGMPVNQLIERAIKAYAGWDRLDNK